MFAMRAASIALMLTASTYAGRIDVGQSDLKATGNCKKVMKNFYCPLQVTEYLLASIGGRSDDELNCIVEFCAAEKPDGQCCLVKKGAEEQLQDPKLTGGMKQETLTKLRKAFGVADSAGVVVEPSKPIWEVEAEQKAKVTVPDKVDDSGADEQCHCPMGGRGVNLAGFAQYSKKQLFSEQGKCTSSTACNQCYHGHKDGVYGCCLMNEDGAPTDCAPELKKPKFNGEGCFCEGVMGKMLKSTLYERGAKHCLPNTDCKVCKSTCSNR